MRVKFWLFLKTKLSNIYNKVQATLVISTPDKSILPLISKWNLRTNNFLYSVIVFQLWKSQSMDNLKLWISQVDFQSQTAIFICFSTAYLKVWFVEFLKRNLDSIENTGYHIFYGKSLNLIKRCHFHSLFCSAHTLYALAKLSVLIALIKWP